MKTPRAMQAGLIEKFARFLEEHPGFSPELMGENAYVYGFQIGNCLLSVEDMERLITTRSTCGWQRCCEPRRNSPTVPSDTS